MRAVAPPSAPLRLLWLACAWVALAVFAAPAMLGSAMGPVLRVLGAATEQHACKCGMKPGKCGCPECAQIERQRLRDRLPDPVSTLKRQCDDDESVTPFAAVPGPVLAAATLGLVPAPVGERTPVHAGGTMPAPRSLEPPTPPPRIAPV